MPTISVTNRERKADGSLQRDAEALHVALSDLVRVYQFRDRERICCHDVSVTQCHALDALVVRGPLALNELAAALYLDKSTASRVVTTLERKGYLVRTGDPRDKRVTVLAVAAAGRRLHERIERDLVEDEKRLLQDFEPEVRAAAAQLISRLARAAEARSGLGSPASCCAPREE